MTDIKIKVKTTSDQKHYEITIKSDCKVEDIMKEIEKCSNIPPCDQRLVFRGKILKPEEPISTYQIEDNVVLILVKSAQSAKQPSTTSSNNLSSNPEDNITVKVKTNLDATVHNVQVNKNATVLGLKGEIEKKVHVPPNQQRLVINGKTMKDGDPIANYSLTNDSSIVMIKHGGEEPMGGGMGGMNNPLMGNPDMLNNLNVLLSNPALLEQVLNSPEMKKK